jgi:L-asparagine transporter-like permease
MIFDYPLIYSLLIGITVYFIIYIYTLKSDNENRSKDISDISFKLPLLTSIISYVIMIFLLHDYDVDIIKNMSPSKTANQIIIMDEFY